MSNLSLVKKQEQSIRTPFLTEKWYSYLVEDCQAILTEGEFTARWTIIQTYHELGTRILEDYDYVKEIGVDKFINGVAEDINKSKRTVYYALQFAQTYPDLDKLPGGKAVSWHRIVHEYLGEKKDEKKPKMQKCPNCGFEYEI